MRQDKIKIINNLNDEIIREFACDNIDAAYIMAASLEEMGLDIRIETPTISDALKDSLAVDTQSHEVDLQACQDSCSYTEVI